MLIHVHRVWVPSGITAGGIVPDSSRARCKPDVEGVEEDAVGVIWVNSDALIVPVLRIIHATVSERTALRARHVAPVRTAICASPGAKLTAVSTAAAAVAIWSNRLALCINVVRVARRDG